jgi:hypothetical protein
MSLQGATLYVSAAIGLIAGLVYFYFFALGFSLTMFFGMLLLVVAMIVGAAEKAGV